MGVPPRRRRNRVASGRAGRRIRACATRPGKASPTIPEHALCDAPHHVFIPFMSASISVQYAARIAAGKIERDEAQEAIVAKLEQLERCLAERRLARKSSSLGCLFCAASPIVRKRRVHFHEFMAEVHDRVHALRQQAKQGETNGEDPVRLAAAAIAQETWLLCFD